MKFSRKDYNERIIDLAGKIPADEPVFLLRGKDPLAPRIVLTYAMELRLIGGDPSMASNLERHAQDMIRYQKEHGTKIPDMYRSSEDKLNLKRILDGMICKWKSTMSYTTEEFIEFQDTLAEYVDPNKSPLCILIKSDLRKDVKFISTEDIDINMFTEDAQLQASKYDIVLFITDSYHLKVLKYEL